MSVETPLRGFRIRPAAVEDTALVLEFIRELAHYERLSHEVVASEALLRETLFGERRVAEVVLGFLDADPVGFALFFPSFSTFLGRPGIYLEDLYVRPQVRGRGIGRALLAHVARIALERGSGRLEWSVLDWNTPALRFYESVGAKPMREWTVQRVSGAALEALADESQQRRG